MRTTGSSTPCNCRKESDFLAEGPSLPCGRSRPWSQVLCGGDLIGAPPSRRLDERLPAAALARGGKMPPVQPAGCRRSGAVIATTQNLESSECYDYPMTRATRELLDEALQLPLDDRAQLAAELLESLDDAEHDVEAAWAAEIERRVAAARAGELESTDWRIVMERVEKEVLRR
jgi:putative addiction module component (TIGR02574 family)